MRCQTEQEDTNISDTLDLSSRCRGCHWSKFYVFIFLQQERDTSDDGVTSHRLVGLFITTHTRADHILYVSFLFYHFQNPVGQPLNEQQVNWVLKQHILCVSAATERSH